MPDDTLGDEFVSAMIDGHIKELCHTSNSFKEFGEKVIENYKKILAYGFRGLETC